jgi:chromate transporter
MRTKTTGAHRVQWRLLLDLFVTFSKIGPVTFGGGYAMIPQIERETVQQHRWMNNQEVIDLLAVSGAAPGAIGINAAFAIGYRVAGLMGAIAAFVGVVLPTFVIVLILASTYAAFKDHPQVTAAFEGIRASIIALILYAAYRMAKSALVDKSTIVQGVIFLVALCASWLSPIWAMVAGPLVGIAITLLKRKAGIYPKVEPNSSEPQQYVYSDYYIGDGI